MSKAMSPAPDELPSHPTKLVVRGAEGPIGQALVDRYRAPLKRFHMGQQQNVALAQENGVTVHRAIADLGGAEATYSNIFGQETLTLTVHPRTVEHEERRVVHECWETLLVELTLLGAVGGGRPIITAILRPGSQNRRIAQLNGQDSERFMFASGMASLRPEMKLRQTSAGQGEDMVFSLRVDLMPLRPGKFKIDLRGSVTEWVELNRPPRDGGVVETYAEIASRVRNFARMAPSGLAPTTGFSPEGVSETPTTGILTDEPDVELLWNLFPELDGISIDYDNYFLTLNRHWLDLRFLYVDGIWLSSGSHSPDNPGAWGVLPPVSITRTYWDAEQQFPRSVVESGIYRGYYSYDENFNLRFDWHADGQNTFPTPPDTNGTHLRFIHSETYYGLTVRYGTDGLDARVSSVFVKQGQPFTHYSVAVDTVSSDEYQDDVANMDRWDSYRWEPQGSRPNLKQHSEPLRVEKIPPDWEFEGEAAYGPLICTLEVDPCAATVKVIPGELDFPGGGDGDSD